MCNRILDMSNDESYLRRWGEMNYTKGLVRAWLVGCTIWIGITVFMNIAVSDFHYAFNYWTSTTLTPSTWNFELVTKPEEAGKNVVVEVALPDGSVAQFPENTPQISMISALDKRFPPNSETNLFKKFQNLRKAYLGLLFCRHSPYSY
jgi:hypothetical protein